MSMTTRERMNDYVREHDSVPVCGGMAYTAPRSESNFLADEIDKLKAGAESLRRDVDAANRNYATLDRRVSDVCNYCGDLTDSAERRLELRIAELERCRGVDATASAAHYRETAETKARVAALEKLHEGVEAAKAPPKDERPAQPPVVGLVFEWSEMTRTVISVRDGKIYSSPFRWSEEFGALSEWDGDVRRGTVKIVSLPKPKAGMRVWCDGKERTVDRVDEDDGIVLSGAWYTRSIWWTPKCTVVLSVPSFVQTPDAPAVGSRLVHKTGGYTATVKSVIRSNGKAIAFTTRCNGDGRDAERPIVEWKRDWLPVDEDRI